MAGLPPAFEGLRVGYITDLHHSEFVGLDDIQRAVALVAAERPDLVLFGGDYVSYGDVRYADPCAEALAVLQAPLGVFAVLGNHDDDRSVPDALRRRGIAVLRDASTAITKNGDTITLAGIRFWTRDAADIARAIGSGRAPVLLAAHDPRRIVEASSLKVAGVIAGHTHGGQIVLPGLGALGRPQVSRGVRPVLERGDARLFVSAASGTVILPIRINCPPEVNVITLRRRDAAFPPEGRSPDAQLARERRQVGPAQVEPRMLAIPRRAGSDRGSATRSRRCGSFQISPASPPESYTSLHLYSTSATSLSTQNPCAYPAGTYRLVNSSADISRPNHRPKLGDPRRTSTTTSKIRPASTRTSLACGFRHCQ